MLLLLQAQVADFAAYRAATRAEPVCGRASVPGEVTVCGRREADRRYRVPLTSTPVRDQVPLQRGRLLEDKIARCGRTAFLQDCGFVGVTMTSGGAGTSLKPRKLAD